MFSGIGGIDLGLERAGMECVAQVEWDTYCTRILEKHWPDVPRWQDIHDITEGELPDADLIAGGFPCQPVSYAGKRKAQDDDRWLWPEFFRIVRMVRPRYVLVENVPGLLTAGFGDIAADLAGGGYDFEWTRLSAAAVGAPHLRNRIFVVAYPEREGPQRHGRQRGLGEGGGKEQAGRGGAGPGEVAATHRTPRGSTGRSGEESFGPGAQQRLRRFRATEGRYWAVEPDVGRVAHGIPNRMDRLKGLGNAVVPQVAEFVGRLIMAD